MNIDQLFESAVPTPYCQIIRWLVKNRILRFTDWETKFGDYIPFDFRIDLAGTGSIIDNLGALMCQRALEIEADLGVEFDSVFCSLFSGVFSGVSTVMHLKQYHNRDVNLAISRRSYEQSLGATAWSVHSLKEKNLVGTLGKNVLLHDEMCNTGNTLREMIEICRDRNIEPRAIMVLADRILDRLPLGQRVRIIESVPCYSLISHYEILEWCKINRELWRKLYQP